MTITEERTEIEDVVHRLGYYRHDHNECVLEVAPVDFALRPNGSIISPPAASLSALDALPVELIQTVFEHVDITTFLSLRLVNRLTCEVVDRCPKFDLLLKVASRTVRAVVLSQLTCYTISDLFYVLTHPDCGICGSFGSFLHLPSCSRCCFSCVRDQMDLIPSMPALADRLNRLDLTDFANANIPGMRSLPGRYSTCHHPDHSVVDKGGFILLFRPHMRRKNKRLDSYLAATDARDGRVEIQKKIDRKMQESEAEIRRSALDADTLLSGMNGPRVPFSTTRTLMAVTPMPYFDLKAWRIQQGVSCTGCYATAATTSQTNFVGARIDRVFASNFVYSDEELYDHVRSCPGALRLLDKWKDSPACPVPAPERVSLQFQRELWSLTCFNLAPPDIAPFADYSFLWERALRRYSDAF